MVGAWRSDIAGRVALFSLAVWILELHRDLKKLIFTNRHCDCCCGSRIRSFTCRRCEFGFCRREFVVRISTWIRRSSFLLKPLPCSPQLLDQNGDLKEPYHNRDIDDSVSVMGLSHHTLDGDDLLNVLDPCELHGLLHVRIIGISRIRHLNH